jgi:hypothetical protein
MSLTEAIELVIKEQIELKTQPDLHLEEHLIRSSPLPLKEQYLALGEIQVLEL